MARRRRRRSPVRTLALGLVALLVLGGVVALVLSLGPGGTTLRTIKRGTPVAALYFTCGLEGKLAPCACEEGSLGGIDRVAGLLGQWRAERTDAIVVDVGNAITVRHEQAREINSITYEAFDAMAYSVANIGENEAALPVDQLVALGGATKTHVISASVQDKGSGQRLFPMYHIEVRGGVRIAFIGLVHDQMDEAAVGKGVQIVAPEDALRTALGDLGDKADVVVVLAYLPPDLIYELARKYPKVNVFLGAKAGASSAPYEMVRHTVIAYVGDQGFSIARLHVAFPKDELPVADGTVRLVDKHVEPAAALKDVVARFDKAVPLKKAPGATFDPKMPCTSSFVGSEVCRICHTPEFYSWQATPHGGAYVTLLQKSKQDDEACLACHTAGYGMPGGFSEKRAILAQADAAGKLRKLEAQLTALRAGDPAALATRGKELEQQIAELKAVDLGAFAALVGAGDEAFEKARQTAKNAVEALKNVGCENCHGGARRHVAVALKDRTAAAKTPFQRADSSARNCARCHNGARPCLAKDTANPFDAATYMGKIKHWAD